MQEADEVLQKGGYELDPKTIDKIALRNLYMEKEELKNEVASDLARASVKSRTNNINKSKADFKKHLIGVKKDKGSELT